MASPKERFEFASDNTAAICPPAWAALAEANSDTEVSYGDDKWTRRLIAQVREIFEFPGGRRFHFQAPGGGEFAIWSE